MASPEYLICLSCETPCYVFEWGEEELAREVACEACANDDPEQFMSPDEFDGLTADQ